jgi:hypothetical protein
MQVEKTSFEPKTIPLKSIQTKQMLLNNINKQHLFCIDTFIQLQKQLFFQFFPNFNLFN